MKKIYINKKNLKKTPAAYWLYGKHPVIAALNNPKRKIFKIIAAGNEILSSEMTDLLKNRSIPLEIMVKHEFDSFLPKDALHQGLCAQVAFLDNCPLEKIIANHQTKHLLILDQVTDPHNIGAIMRTSAAFDVSAVIIPEKNSCPETGVLAKSASGALDLIPIVRVVNLVSAIKLLKKNNFWIIGLDAYSEKELSQIEIPSKTVLVLGSEGSGLRRLTLENCDFTAKLPISKQIESLNVSNAAAIALYEIAARKKAC